MDSDEGRGSDREKRDKERRREEKRRKSRTRNEDEEQDVVRYEDSQNRSEDSRQSKKEHRKHKEEKSRHRDDERRERKKEKVESIADMDDLDQFPVKDTNKREQSHTSQKEPLKRDDEVMLWNLALNAYNQQQNQQGSGQTADERSILFVGGKDAGKTTIIFRFLEREEAPKPTTALEYTFGRRNKESNLDKEVAHIWELGGGTWLSQLSGLVITPENIESLSLILVLDLSKPEEMWITLERWLDVLKQRIDGVLSSMNQGSSSYHGDANALRSRLKRAATIERYGSDHQDLELLDSLLLPAAILCTKYDLFQDFDSEKRKVICKTLRFVAHRNGAHLQFVSSKQEALLSRTRVVISHFVFGTPIGKFVQTDHNKPLMITVGQDSLQKIGSPPLAEGDLGRVTARTPMDLWKQAFNSYFPQQSSINPSVAEDPTKDKQFSEAAVDSMRAQKNEELERYRKASERKEREAYGRTVKAAS